MSISLPHCPENDRKYRGGPRPDARFDTFDEAAAYADSVHRTRPHMKCRVYRVNGRWIALTARR